MTNKFAEGDQAGAMNYVTAECTLNALKSVGQGRIIDLSQEIKSGHPCMQPAQSPFMMTMRATPEMMLRGGGRHGITNNLGAYTERVELCMHTGTHVDALGHVTIADEMYGGYRVSEMTNNLGLQKLGIEQMPPLISRGVCIDVAGLDGGDYLEGGRVVTARDLKNALNKAKVEIAPGDVVMVRTGYSRYFMKDNQKYISTEPGIDVEAAQWLTEQKVSVIGCDNMGVEVLPYPEKGKMLPVHQHTLVEAGVHLIENLVLDELARQNVTTFCFIMLPVKFTGATASPVRPIAVL